MSCIDTFPDIVKNSLVAPDEAYSKLKKSNRNGIIKDTINVILNFIPSVGGGLASGIEKGLTYSDSRLFRYLYSFIYELGDISQKDRKEFMNKVEKVSEDYSGNVLCDMINRLDNINKSKILANLTRATINKDITIEDFFRLSSICEKIPYSDFPSLLSFQSPTYVEGGVTEILYSTGTLIQASISSGQNNKFSLSVNGLKLLKFGLVIDVDMNSENKTEIDSLNWETLDGGEYS